MCKLCGKPIDISMDDFRQWFAQPRSEPFVPLREFLKRYCQCA